MEVAYLYIGSLKGKKRLGRKKRERLRVRKRGRENQEARNRGEFQLAHLF
jgi:hypothetical protein